MGEEEIVLSYNDGFMCFKQQEQCLGLEFPEKARLSSALLTIQ